MFTQKGIKMRKEIQISNHYFMRRNSQSIDLLLIDEKNIISALKDQAIKSKILDRKTKSQSLAPKGRVTSSGPKAQVLSLASKDQVTSLTPKDQVHRLLTSTKEPTLQENGGQVELEKIFK
jgi:hypothetical protein